MPVSVSVVPSDSDVETVTFSVTVAVVVVVIVVGVVVVVVVVVVVGITWISVTFIFAFKTHLLVIVSENKTESEGRGARKFYVTASTPPFGHQPTATVEFSSVEKTGSVKVLHFTLLERGSNLNPLQSILLEHKSAHWVAVFRSEADDVPNSGAPDPFSTL